MTVTGTAFYGMVGALIDNAIDGRVVVYTRTAHTVSLNVAPVVSLGQHARIGIATAMTWK